MSVLIIAELDQQQIKAATRSAITAAQSLGNQIDVLVMGSDVKSIAIDVAAIEGVSRVLFADNELFKNPLAEVFAPFVKKIAQEYKYVVVAATSFGKNLLPRVSALLDVDMVSEVTQIVDGNTFLRPLYAGNLNATVQNNEAIKLLTIRPTAFVAAKNSVNAGVVDVVDVAIENNSLSEFVGLQIQRNERPELSASRVVITGGRSLGSAEKFDAVLSPLALKLNAALGATRAAVDAGFAPNEWQVGQTGTVVAPDLYIALGVSGAVQHFAGMKDSRMIVAINHDPDAPIFQWADYGLVADLFESAETITAAL